MVVILPALFLATLFIVFANMFSVVYLDDALHGASLRTLLSCVGVNACGGLIMYIVIAYSGLPILGAYLVGSGAVIGMETLFWFWWFGTTSRSVKVGIVSTVALILALGTFYGLREYTHILHH